MTENGRDHLVERFLSGTMTADEERAFRSRLETDTALQRVLEINGSLYSAAGKDRWVDAAAAAETHHRLMSMIASGAAATAVGSLEAAAPAAGTVASGLAAKTVAALIAIGAVTGGIFLVRSASETSSPTPSHTVEHAPARGMSLTPRNGEATMPQPVSGNQSVSTTATQPQTAREQVPHAASLATPHAGTLRAAGPVHPETPSVTAPATLQEAGPHAPVVIKEDTTRVQIRLDLPRE